MQSIAEKMRVSEPTAKIGMKIDPCSQGVPGDGALNNSGIVENGNFQRFRWLFLSAETLEMKPAL